MSASYAGCSYDEVKAIVPLLVLLSQVEGQADFYVNTIDEIKAFITKLPEEGWHVTRFPAPLNPLEELPVSTKVPLGKCKHDLPVSKSSSVKERANVKKQLTASNRDYVNPVIHQDKKWCLKDANVYLHLTCRVEFLYSQPSSLSIL